MSKKRKPWYSDGLSFECTQCGRCCTGEPGDVWCEPEEIDRMAEYIGMAADEFRERFVRRMPSGNESLRERVNGDCVMLDIEGKRCVVYEVRPRQCSAWPFWRDSLKSRAAWESYSRHCPGMNRGRRWTLEEIREKGDWR